MAQRAEDVGLWGIGIGDSPRYAELYSACTSALDATNELRVTTCVTNPVTRHWSLHAAAARGLVGEFGARLQLGFGRGDSAVHSFGMNHATLRELETALTHVREAVDVPLLLACSGDKTAAIGGRAADGIIAGVGRHISDIERIAAITQGAAAANVKPSTWATIRIAVVDDVAAEQAMRRRLIPRAISASHFAFGSTFAGKGVPEEFQEIMAERYERYDYQSHGSSGTTSNAELFIDHPEIENYLLDRFAIIGTIDTCAAELDALANHVDGVFLSMLFEDALDQIDKVGQAAREISRLS
ncbi:LLM class flavin-dependent oxidoreductase [Microbacterium sp. NC79]|nr:LLM class flavin-dependent oxidoreductase [Microbacterium sp. NC79]